MTGTVYFGISALMVLSFIAVPAITILGGYSVYLAVNDLGGIAEMQKIVPAVDQKIDFNTALALVIGSFISAGTLTADFVRFGRKPKAAVAITLIAFFIGNSLMFIFAAATGFADISDVMMTQGLLIPAIIVLGLNIWTTNDNALYASGLGFSNITGIDSKKLAMINGVIGTVFALWLYNNFVGWLSFLSAAIPPIGGVLIDDYFLIHRGQYVEFAKAEFETIRWQALIAAGQLLPGVVSVNAVIGGAVAYFISCKVMGPKSINTTTKKSAA
ncbi:cytosine permease [Moritella sp.]|uniref:cytosine permease n=1 Tax=Moritella sp. TaxID=78556 RepID=UPI0026005A82|nr:cytosine permease [Moritella sp.]